MTNIRVNNVNFLYFEVNNSIKQNIKLIIVIIILQYKNNIK